MEIRHSIAPSEIRGIFRNKDMLVETILQKNVLSPLLRDKKMGNLKGKKKT